MKAYKADLEIDVNDMDTCCLKQPFLYECYSQKVVPLYKLKDELKLEIEKFTAKMDIILRESYSAEGKKATENMIQNQIINNPQYVDLQQKYINTCAELKEAEIIKEAFQQRRDMLKLLTEQYISGYWSTVTPKVIKQQATESLKDKLKEKMLEEKKEK